VVTLVVVTLVVVVNTGCNGEHGLWGRVVGTGIGDGNRTNVRC